MSIIKGIGAGAVNRGEFLKSFTVNNTRILNRTALRNFDKFLKVNYKQYKESEILIDLKQTEDGRYVLLKEMIEYWKNDLKLSPSSMRAYLTCVRTWLRRNSIKTNNDDIRDYIKIPKQVQEEKFALEIHHAKLLLKKSNLYYSILWELLYYSGMRLAEAITLTPDNFEFDKTPTIIKINGKNTKNKKSRITFCPSDTSLKIQTIIKKYNKLNNQPIYIQKKYNSVEQAKDPFEQYFYRLRIKTGLNEKYELGRHKITIHSFRSHFITKVSNLHNDYYAHLLTGHQSKSVYLPTYYRLSIEEQMKMYLKVQEALKF